MWIAPYHRDRLPPGIDNSQFGEVVREISLTQDASGIANIIESSEEEYPPSIIIPTADPGARYYGRCSSAMRRAISKPVAGTVFFPDHAVLVETEDGRKLLTESLWHSQLFFSNYFRCDRSTSWKWRSTYVPQDHSVVEDRVINCYHRFSFQYFHWFADTMPRIWLAAKQGLRPTDGSWLVGPLSQPFQEPSLKLFGLEPNHIWDSPGGDTVSFKQMMLVSFSFNESVGTLRPGFQSGQYFTGWSSEYFADLRDRAHSMFNIQKSIEGRSLFIDRSAATHRKIVNKDAVLARIEDAGYEFVDPGAMTFEEQVATFSQARIILGVHGAGLTNSIWARPGAVVAEFMPSGLYDVGYRFLAPMSGHKHLALFCKPLAHELGIAYSDVEVDLGCLNTFLAEVERQS